MSDRLPLVFILTTLMIDAMGIGLILPVMPALIREVDEASLAQAALWGGILTTTFAVMQFVFAPVLGNLSDRYGRRPVLLLSLTVMALDYLVMALAGTIWLLLAGRVVGGMTAATQSVATAFIADITPSEKKAARFGLLGAAFGVGFVVGPLIGGLLGELGTRAPFYAAAALAALNAVLGYFVLPETLAVGKRRPFRLRNANPFGAFRQLGRLPDVGRLVITFFLYNVAFTVYPAIWAYFTEARFGWDPGLIGLSLGAFGIGIAIVQGGLIRYVIGWLGEAGTVRYGLAFNALAFLAFAFVSSGTLGMILTPLTALGAVVTPALQAMMSQRVGEDRQGALQGLVTSAASLAMIVSPLIMTGIFFAFTREGAAITLPGAPFLLSMALMGACAVVFAGRVRRKPAP